ncbi:cysteine hydrolase [Hominimerdicola sp. 21CYCFAH17_S]
MKLLIVVDYQNDFVDGSLGFEEAERLDSIIASKIAQYRRNGDAVAFTLDTHYDNYNETQEGRKLPVPHCIKGTRGHELYGKTAKQRIMCDMLFEKNTFPSLEMAEYLKQKEYESVELAGLVSNICVISNAVMVKAALPEAEIIVDASCTAGADKALHEKCLDVMEGMQITVLGRKKQRKVDK